MSIILISIKRLFTNSFMYRIYKNLKCIFNLFLSNIKMALINTDEVFQFQKCRLMCFETLTLFIKYVLKFVMHIIYYVPYYVFI
jgi:hypothetical protein